MQRQMPNEVCCRQDGRGPVEKGDRASYTRKALEGSRLDFSLMTYTVHGGQPGGIDSLEGIADFASELGFAALELSAGRDLAEHAPAEIADLCRARGLALSCINGAASLSARDSAEFAAGLQKAREMVDAAAAMGCPVVMLIPGMAESEADLPRAAERIVEGLREVIPYAERAGVTVTIEDFPNPLAPYASIAQVRYLLDNAPGLRLTFDNGNWLIGGDDPVAAIDEFADEIVNVHIKDWEPDPNEGSKTTPDGTAIRGGLHGEGILDQPAILRRLVEVGYDGILAYEYEGVEDHQEATRRGMAYLRGLLGEIAG